MNINKLLYVLISITCLAIGIMMARIVLGGPEDTWICSGGEWVKHGNPSVAMPQEGCDSIIQPEPTTTISDSPPSS